MLDPFPYPAPKWLLSAFQSSADSIAAPTLPTHIHEVVLSYLMYWSVGAYFAPWISKKIFPEIYASFSKRTKLSWDVHIVSLFQSITICGTALWIMIYDEERKSMDWQERVLGYTGSLGLLQAMATGYFTWDLWITASNLSVFGWGFLAHAISAITVFVLGFRPFVNYYAPSFLLYELSSPFLNFHWFFDKLNMTGSTPQLINGIFLIMSFFGARLIWGVWQSIRVFQDVFRFVEYQHSPAGQQWFDSAAKKVVAAAAAAVGNDAKAEVLQYASRVDVPMWLAFVYLGSNLVLNALNVYWFGKMIETIRSRFEPPFGTKKVSSKKEITLGRGLQGDGVQSVEVDATEVRHRNPRRKA